MVVGHACGAMQLLLMIGWPDVALRILNRLATLCILSLTTVAIEPVGRSLN